MFNSAAPKDPPVTQNGACPGGESLPQDRDSSLGKAPAEQNLCQKQAAEQQTLLSQVLERLNQPLGQNDLIHDILALIHEGLGLDAVGIRFREGEDYPYYAVHGFSESFLDSEHCLLKRCPDGSVLRDSQGKACLDCVCGLVLRSGRCGDAMRVSQGGSFWVNSALEMRQMVADEPSIAFRGRCQAEGFESVAWVPLRNHSDIIGLLQLNDRRKDQFGPQQIEFFERLGTSIGIAFERQRVEQALRQERDRAQQYLDTAQVILTVISPRGEVLLVNRRGCQVLGYEEKELLGQSWLEKCVPARMHEQIRRVGRNLLAGESESTQSIEGVLRTNSGEELTIDWYLSVLRDSLGQICGVLASGIDITERKRAEKALAESARFNRLLRQLLASMNACQTFDQVLETFLSVSLEVGRMNWGAVAVVRQDWVEVRCQQGYPPELLKLIERLPLDFPPLQLMLEQPRPINLAKECYPWHSTAQRFEVQQLYAVPLRVSNRLWGYLYQGSHEIAQSEEHTSQCLAVLALEVQSFFTRWQAEDALRLSKERLLLAQAVAHLGSWDLDLRSGRVTGSKEASVIYGLETDSPSLEQLNAVFEPQDLSRLQSALQKLYAAGTEVDEQLCIRKADTQQKRIILCRAQGVRDESGELVRVTGIVQDITEQAQLEAQLRQAQKMESVGRLAGGVAHDFNNLLSAILGYADMALEDLHSHDPLHSMLLEIRKAGERAKGLTQQLLAFSRRQVLSFQPLDLNHVIVEMEKMLRRLIGEDIELQTDLSQAPLCIKADLSQLQQILLNLAVNARDAMPGVGRLQIQTAWVSPDEASLCQELSSPCGPWARLSISDSGCGMDVHTQAHIFEPFFTTKAEGKGTGLGLAMVYGIVQQHGGLIQVHSQLGIGTTFHLYFPCQPLAVAASAPSLIPAGPGGNETVLVVEDDEMVRTLACRVLRRCGYKVLEAPGPSQALALSKHPPAPIDLLLTDVVMPEMDGRQLYRTLCDTLGPVPVLYMSGYSDRGFEIRAREGDSFFIQKPFTIRGLAQKVREALDSMRQ